MKPIEITIPNIDGISANDPQEIRQLGAEIDKLRDNLRKLGQYVELRADAMELRLKGNVADALKLEAFMETIFTSLPPDMKW